MKVNYALTIAAHEVLIDWHHGFANSPSATIVVTGEDFTYFGFENEVWQQSHGRNYCYATKDNMLFHFLAARNTGILPRSAMMGFGGHEFALHCLDGSTVVTNNAWSGNARDFCDDMRTYEGEHPFGLPLRDVSIVNGDDPARRTPWAGFAIRKDLLEVLVQNAGFYMTPQGTISTHPTKAMKPEGTREYPGTMSSHFGETS